MEDYSPIDQKVTKDFVNPITGDTEKISVTAKATKQQVEDLLPLGIDVYKMLCKSAQKELDRCAQIKKFNCIRNYAAETYGVKEVNINGTDERRRDDFSTIRDITFEFVKDVEKPVMYAPLFIRILMGAHMTMTGTVYSEYPKNHFTLEPTLPCFVKFDLPDINAQRTLSIYENFDYPFYEKRLEVLLFDEDNPKYCRIYLFKKTLNSDYKNFKPGDIIVDDADENEYSVAIFKNSNYDDNKQTGCMFLHCSYRKLTDKLYQKESGGHNPKFWHFANKKQQQLLFDKLEEHGYFWDTKALKIKYLDGNDITYSVHIDGLTKEQAETIDALAKTWNINVDKSNQ